MSKVIGIDLGTTFSAIASLDDLGNPEVLSSIEDNRKITASAIYINKFRVPASYLNFYIFNKFVLLPTFKDPKDKKVIKIFKKEFSNRKIVPIDCSELIWGFGAIHCLTQQEPK